MNKVKAENGGKITIDNSALLTQRAHNYLHLIERIDIDIYNRINAVLKEINENKSEPTIIQRKKILINLLKKIKKKNILKNFW